MSKFLCKSITIKFKQEDINSSKNKVSLLYIKFLIYVETRMKCLRSLFFKAAHSDIFINEKDWSKNALK